MQLNSFGHRPIPSVWYPFDPRYRRSSVCPCESLSVINSAMQALFDLAILIYPIPIFRVLKIDRRAMGEHACSIRYFIQC